MYMFYVCILQKWDQRHINPQICILIHCLNLSLSNWSNLKFQKVRKVWNWIWICITKLDLRYCVMYYREYRETWKLTTIFLASRNSRAGVLGNCLHFCNVESKYIGLRNIEKTTWNFLTRKFSISRFSEHTLLFPCFVFSATATMNLEKQLMERKYNPVRSLYISLFANQKSLINFETEWSLTLEIKVNSVRI